jgi:hypothetical protein
MIHLFRRLKVSWVAIVAPLALCLVYAPWMSSQEFRERVIESDFVPLYTAGRMVLEGQVQRLYDLPEQRRFEWRIAPELEQKNAHTWFPYPPVVAFVFSGIAPLSLEDAYRVWGAINVALLLCLIQRCILALEPKGKGNNSLIATRCLAFFPVVATLFQGQLSFLIALSFFAAWRAIRANKPLRAGLFLSFLSIKPYMLFLPMFLLLWKRQKAILLGVAIGGAFFAAISWLLVGMSGARDFAHVLSLAATGEDLFSLNRASTHCWRGFLINMLGDANPGWIGVLWLLGSLMAFSLLIATWRGELRFASQRFNLQWGALIMTIIFTAPHLHWHDLTLLLVAAVLAVSPTREQSYSQSPSRYLRFILPCGYATIWLAALAPDLAPRVTVPLLLLALVVLTLELRRLGSVRDQSPERP